MPNARRSIPESIYPFWNYWDELSVEDELIFKIHKLMIPTSQLQEFLKDLHVMRREDLTLCLRGCILSWNNRRCQAGYQRDMTFTSQQDSTSGRSPHPTCCF